MQQLVQVEFSYSEDQQDQAEGGGIGLKFLEENKTKNNSKYYQYSTFEV